MKGANYYDRAVELAKQRNQKEGLLTTAPPAELSGWHKISDDTAFAPPFGTIRVCIDCGCLVAGGPTRCVKCADRVRYGRSEL